MNKLLSIAIIIIASIFINHSCTEPCDNIICLNEGICNDGSCECPEGFEGVTCEIELSKVVRQLKRVNYENSYTDYQYTENGLLHKESDGIINSDPSSETVYTFINDTLYQTRTDLNTNNEFNVVKLYLVSNKVLEERSFATINGESVTSLRQYTFIDNCGFEKYDVIGSEFSTIYEYTDTNCSYTLTNSNATSDFEWEEITRDNGKDPYTYRYEYFFPMEFGNITRIDKIDLNTDPSGNTLFETSITANVFVDKYGYPTRIVTTSLSDVVTEKTFEYYE